MARVVILGAGISGHAAAPHLRRLLGKGHEVVVVSPNADWNWIPSNIWVGVGRMSPEGVTFPLAPVYRRQGIEFHQARAAAIWPEGEGDSGHPAVEIVSTLPDRSGERSRVTYDYLINATGPELNFAATPAWARTGTLCRSARPATPSRPRARWRR